VETYNKKLLLGNSYFVQSLLSHLAGIDVEPSQSPNAVKQDAAGPLVVMGLLQTLEGCLCSRRSTTGSIEFRQIVEEVAGFYSTLLKILFQSRCATTVEACTYLALIIIVTTITNRASIQALCCSRRHWRNAIQ